MNAKGKSQLFGTILIWSIAVFFADYWFLLPSIKQLLAEHYSVAQGRLIESDVEVMHDDEGGDSERLNLLYTYHVGDRDYQSRRYSYDYLSYFARGGASDFAALNPVGTAVSVFYDPTNPIDAVLANEPTSQQLAELIFVTPLNLIMFASWLAGMRRLFWQASPVTGGVEIVSRPRQTIVRLLKCPRIVCAIGSFTGFSILSLIIFNSLLSGEASLRFMIVIWITAAALSIFCTLIYQYIILCGKYDLVIDELHGVLYLPRTNGRKTSLRLRFNQIQAFCVEQNSIPDSEGCPPTFTYSLYIEFNNGTSKSETLVKWRNKEKAYAILKWLREKIQVTAPQRALAGKFERTHAD